MVSSCTHFGPFPALAAASTADEYEEGGGERAARQPEKAEDTHCWMEVGYVNGEKLVGVEYLG